MLERSIVSFGGSMLRGATPWIEATSPRAVDSRWLSAPTGQVGTNDGVSEEWFCSGFLSDKRHFITAGHCVSGVCASFEEDKRNFRVRFGFEEDGEVREYALNKITEHGTCYGKDYAVFEMSSGSAADRYGVPRLSIEAQVSNNIVVAHHPNGESKKVSYGKLVGASMDRGLFRHTANTLPGSSGAPLGRSCSETVVGIHIAGCGEIKDAPCDGNTAVSMLSLSENSEYFSRVFRKK